MTKVPPATTYEGHDLSIGLAEQAQLIQWHVGVWHDLGYPEPLPSPDCHPIPPLGERPAGAIEGGHAAVRDIDEMLRHLYALREHLVSELRQDEDIRAVRVDAMLTERKSRRPDQRAAELAMRMTRKSADRAECGCPKVPGQIRHQRGICTDPVVARLDWYANGDEAGRL